VCCCFFSHHHGPALPPKMAKMVNMAKMTKAAMATWRGDTVSDGVSV
jgi:hypothetical protein